MSVIELIEMFMDMPETMEGLKSEGEFVVLDTRKVAEALKKSLRNCDVGTADEQEDRFERSCDAHKYVGDDRANICSKGCPCYNNVDCWIRWAHMPYEEGGAKMLRQAAEMRERTEELKARCLKICGRETCDHKGDKCVCCTRDVIDFIVRGDAGTEEK